MDADTNCPRSQREQGEYPTVSHTWSPNSDTNDLSMRHKQNRGHREDLFQGGDRRERVRSGVGAQHMQTMTHRTEKQQGPAAKQRQPSQYAVMGHNGKEQEKERTHSLLLWPIISLEEGMPTHSGILAWMISWTEEPGGLQSMVLQGVYN